MAPRILIVDDNHREIDLLREALHERGIDAELHVASCVDDALTLIEHSRPRFDLILVDIDLPRTPGTEIVHFVRGNDELRRIPLMIFTGLPCHVVLRSCDDLPPDLCQEKPHTFEAYLEFIDRLRQLLPDTADSPSVR